MFQAEALSPLASYGTAVGSAIICSGLFIWSQIQSFSLKQDLKDLKDYMKTDEKNFGELKTLVVGSINSQQSIANSLERIAEAIQHQTESHTAQLDFLREMSSDQKVLLNNQVSAQAGTQRLLEQMVNRLTES